MDRIRSKVKVKFQGESIQVQMYMQYVAGAGQWRQTDRQIHIIIH